MVRSGMLWRGKLGRDRAVMARHGKFRFVPLGCVVARRGSCGEFGRGRAWFGKVRLGLAVEASSGLVGQVPARYGVYRQANSL